MIQYIFYILSTLFGFGLSYKISNKIAATNTGDKGKVPSLNFRFKKWRIHLHHWMLSFLVGMLLIYYNAIFEFYQFLFLLGSAVGITTHGIKRYKDWKRIIYKEDELERNIRNNT